MLEKKSAMMIILVMILSLWSNNSPGKTIVIQTCLRQGHRIARPLTQGVCISPACRIRPHYKKTVTGCLHRRFIWNWPTCHDAVVAIGPCAGHIMVNLCPTITLTAPNTVVEHATTMVWITNSNGSRTAVKLINSGPGFVGPRGELYPEMPTEEQLKMVYGF